MLGSGLLLRFWAWQSMFWALAGVGVLILLLTLTVSESRDGHAPPVDWPGAALIGAAVAILVYGVIEVPSRGWSDPVVYCCIAAGLVLAAVFGVVEWGRRHPLLPVRLFARPDFTTGAATVMVLYLATFGFFYLFMQYAQLVRGYSPLQTALAFAPLIVPVTTLSGFSFWYLPKLGLRLVVFLGLLMVAVGFLCMHRLDLHSSYVDLAWPLLVLSTGIGLCTAPATAAIMSAAPDGKLGIAIAGSMLAAQYTRTLTPRLSAFPEPLRGPATDSLAKAIEVSHRLGPHGAGLADINRTAFLHAMQSRPWWSVCGHRGVTAPACTRCGGPRNGSHRRSGGRSAGPANMEPDRRGSVAGYQRGLPFGRTVGPKHEPREFETFAMAALAGIGRMPETIQDRSVFVAMKLASLTE